MNVRTSIVIVNHKTAEVLMRCIETLYKFENSNEFEVVIIDNASGDNSKEAIETISAKHSNICTIILPELKSFSYANNRGIEKSIGEYTLIMNPDIIFEEPVLGELIKQMTANKEYGAVSPALVGTDGNFQRNYFQRYPTLRQFIYFNSIFLRYFYRSPRLIDKFLLNDEVNIHQKKIYEVEQIPCAFFLTRKKLLDEIGMMDEGFELFFEDVDLSYRIHNKGYTLAVDTDLHVLHLGGSSFKDVEWWIYGRFITSMIYFFRKHYSPSKYHVLKFIARSNARSILLIEWFNGLFGRQSEFRKKKFGNFLKLSKNS